MENKGVNTCVACKETSEQVALHYTRMMCNGCRAFFKRTVQGKVKVAECKSGGQCVVDPNTRKLCKACRFEACQRAGVDSSKVQQPKEEGSVVDPQLHTDMYIPGGQHHLRPSPFLPPTSYSQFQLVQGSRLSQNMFPNPHVISDTAPSMGRGVFNHSLSPNFANGHLPGLHAILDSQSQFPANSHTTSMGDHSLQMWRSAAFHAGTESTRLPTSFRLPYLSSPQRQTEAMSYMGVSNNVPTMGQVHFHHSNVVANPDGIVSRPPPIPHPALYNYATHFDARSLAHAWNSGYRSYQTAAPYLGDVPNTLQNPRRAIYDPPTSKDEANSSKKADSPFSYARYTDDIVVDEHCKTGSSQRTNGDVKEEAFDPDHGPTEVMKDDASRFDVSAEPRSRAVHEGPHEHSVASIRNSEYLAESLRLAAVTMNKHKSAFTPLISNSFMMDNLLRPQQHISVQQQNGHDRVGFVPRVCTPTWYSHPRHRNDNEQFSAANARHAEGERLRMASPVGSDIGKLDSRRFAPKHADGDASSDDSQDDVDVCSSDEGSCCNQSLLDSRTGQRADQKITCSENESSPSDSECENDNCPTLERESNVIEAARNSKLEETHPSPDKCQRLSVNDSGLGTSSHILHCHQTNVPPNKALSHTTANASTVSEKKKYNNENVPATTRRKRKPLLPTESRISKTKLAKTYSCNLQPAPLAKRQCTRDSRLREILENGQETREEELRAETNRSLLSASGAESTSADDDESATEMALLRPQLTSTPVALSRDNKTRRFTQLMCAFANFYQTDDVSLSDNNMATDDNSAADKLSISWPGVDDKMESPSPLDKERFMQSSSFSDMAEKIEQFQQELTRKLRGLDTYTMAEFKTDVFRFSSLVQKMETQGKLIYGCHGDK